jgi:hypothetical protein
MVSVFVEYRVDEFRAGHELYARTSVLLHDLEVIIAQTVVVKQHMPPQLVAIINVTEAHPQPLPSVRRGLGVKDQRPVGRALNYWL